jgi:cytochrome c biogenesis protein CcmG/thiol:disulfide interchange protein DsbE
VTLASLRGHPVVINFWASWCVPCREEFPIFRRAYEEHHDRDGLEIVGIARRDIEDDARSFARSQHATWTLALDESDDAGRAYGVRAMPQTIFVDRTGHIVTRYYGAPASQARFDATLARILAR